MKRLVATILVVVGLMTVTAPECSGPLGDTTLAQGTVSVSASSSAPSVSLAPVGEGKSHESDCGDLNHECHQCHFGHCGFIISQTRFSPNSAGSQFGLLMQNINLESFIPVPFRPPIV